MSAGFWTNANNYTIKAGIIELGGKNQAGVATPPIVINTAQTVPVANLYAERAAAADNISGNITGDTMLMGWLSTTANIDVGTYLEVGTDAIIGGDVIVGGYVEIAANASVGTDLSVGGDITAGGNVQAFQIESTATTGTPPFIVASTTLVPNLYVARAALADTCTTIPNLTGPITSIGNGTLVAAQTGTGSVFVMQATPTLTTPNIGAATGTSLDVTGDVQGSQLISDVSIGTAPLAVTSTTLVPNLYVARAALADTSTAIPNLTGPITSVGVATSVAAQTGTGSVFVMQDTPTLTTPVIGAATGTSLDVSGALQGATVTADATTNQLVLGTTNTTTISSTAPAASRVVTLHDAGAASNIVLDTGGAMTISNSATIGHVLTATSATASNWAAPAPAGAMTAETFTGTTTATAAGTTALVSTATTVQVFTGVTTETVTLPVTTGKLGMTFTIINMSTGTVTLQDSAANAVDSLTTVTSGVYVCVGVAGVAADWKKVASG